MTERKHTLVRVGKGDYLLLSNDATTLWRIYTYHEDGSAVTTEGRTLKGKYWAYAKYMRIVVPGQPVTVDDWNDFEPWEMLLPSRAEAIDAVMREGEP